MVFQPGHRDRGNNKQVHKPDRNIEPPSQTQIPCTCQPNCGGHSRNGKPRKEK